LSIVVVVLVAAADRRKQLSSSNDSRCSRKFPPCNDKDNNEETGTEDKQNGERHSESCGMHEMNDAIDFNKSNNKKPFKDQSHRQMNQEEPTECTAFGEFSPVPN
jgi:hypothetical protein